MTLVEESVVKIDSQEAEVTKCKDMLKEDTEAVTAAEEALKSASKEVAAFDENLQVTVAEKDHCSAVYNEYFIPLKAGGIDAKEHARLLKEIQPMLKKLCTESSLLNAMAPAFKKRIEGRGPFDVMVIESAEEAMFTKRLGELQSQVDNADECKTEKVRKETAAQDTLKTATEKNVASEEALKLAEETLASLKSNHEKLLADMNKAGEDSQASEAIVTIKEGRFTAVQSALGAFEDLLARESVKPDPVVEEKVEAVSEPSPMELVA